MSDLKRTNTGIVLFNKTELPHFPEGKIIPPNGLSVHEVARYSKKIKECSKDEIWVLISSLCTILEMPKTNYPVDADKKILINLVKTELQHESYKEILQAFKDATKGSFDIDLTTYGVFSYAYMNRVLRAYKQWLISSRKIKELPDAPIQKTPEQIEQENLAALKRNCKNVFEELNKGVEAGKIFIQPSLYNILKDNGLIQTKKWPKVEGYKSWGEQCSNEYLKLNPKKEIYEPITAEGAKNDGMKMAVIYTIQALIKEKANSEILEIIEGLKWVK